jgi:hypothetical protein
VIWALWNIQNGFVFNKPNKFFLAGYSYAYPLDLYVVLSPTRGATGGDRLWVQPFGDGSSRFIQPVRLTVA